jgi:hypothetical protein
LDTGSFTYQMRTGSPRWQASFGEIEAASISPPERGARHFDAIPAAATHVVIVDGISRAGGRGAAAGNVGPSRMFRNAFVQRLSADKPSIAIATGSAHGGLGDARGLTVVLG